MNTQFRNTEASSRSGEAIGFSFGENWAKYLSGMAPEAAVQAQSSLQRSFAGRELAGESFLDLGCGSGLFSLCAHVLGADKVVSVDVDPSSVACADGLRKGSDAPERWIVRRGSVLDPEFVRSLGSFSRVYSWGVLHHTGAMWEALENAQSVVAPGGLLCVALYLEPRYVRVHMALKRIYNRSPHWLRPVIAAAFAFAWLAARTARRKGNPISFVRSYGEKSRGMSFFRDVDDWLGGLPCEFAEPEDVRAFLVTHGFREVAYTPGRPGGNSEYLFQRQDS
jgi:2-polyprenyl-6-hydroxyphenyl methylase/3-demethylubiquinone-9 3-methyltransferase